LPLFAAIFFAARFSFSVFCGFFLASCFGFCAPFMQQVSHSDWSEATALEFPAMLGRRTLALLSLLAASALCVATLEIRTQETGDDYYRFLVWNLILAWVPLALAIAAYARARRRVDPLVWVLLVPWLLFFPNAPYLLTDFIHLNEGPAPLWYDALMLSAFAWTGLLLGFASLYLVQMILRRAFGRRLAWLGVVAVLGLASVGVYVGRFIRFNSWDALLHPLRVADVIQEQLGAVPMRMAEALVGLTAFLVVGYLAVYSFTDLKLELEREEEPGRSRARA
jgi:uncharacterized membrane protein